MAKPEQERQDDSLERRGPVDDAAPRSSNTADTKRRWAAVGPILVLEVMLWIAVFGVGRLFHDGPNGKAMGTDFAVFSGAANALKHGQNPYDYRVLYRSERALLTRQHLPVTTNEF